MGIQGIQLAYKPSPLSAPWCFLAATPATPDIITPYLIKSNEQGTPGSAKGSFLLTATSRDWKYAYFVYPSSYAVSSLSNIYKYGYAICGWIINTATVLLAGASVKITYCRSSENFLDDPATKYTWTVT